MVQVKNEVKEELPQLVVVAAIVQNQTGPGFHIDSHAFLARSLDELNVEADRWAGTLKRSGWKVVEATVRVVPREVFAPLFVGYAAAKGQNQV